MMLLRMVFAGGLFAVLAFIHFFGDWLFQSHAEAMAKSHDWKVRAKHCAVYTAFFAVPLMWMGLSLWQWLASMNVLFWSHFFEDTYKPVLWWARYIRRPPEFLLGPEQLDAEYRGDKLDTGRFLAFVSTPLGKILMIAVDQIIHLTFLWVPAILAVSNLP